MVLQKEKLYCLINEDFPPGWFGRAPEEDLSVRRKGWKLREGRLALPHSLSMTASRQTSRSPYLCPDQWTSTYNPFSQRGGRRRVLLSLGRRRGFCVNLLQVGTSPFCSIFLSATSARLMVSKEPGPPGQPRVQDLRLEQEENLKIGSEKQVVGWQAVVTWDPADTPEGRTFTLQCCRCSP